MASGGIMLKSVHSHQHLATVKDVCQRAGEEAQGESGDHLEDAGKADEQRRLGEVIDKVEVEGLPHLVGGTGEDAADEQQAIVAERQGGEGMDPRAKANRDLVTSGLLGHTPPTPGGRRTRVI